MTEYCMFTIEHSEARRIYVRGIADITEPIDDYHKVIKFSNGVKLQSRLPPNPYEAEAVEYELYEELIYEIKSNFDDLGDELVFAEEKETICKYLFANCILTKQKGII